MVWHGNPWRIWVAVGALALFSRGMQAQNEGKTAPGPGDIYVNAHGTRFRYCPPGEFTMGSTAAERKALDADREILQRETPHRVRLTRGFWIAEAETSQREWKAVLGPDSLQTLCARWTALGMRLEIGVVEVSPLHGTKPPGFHRETTEAHPMYWVSWDNAVEYCRALTEHGHRSGSLPAQWKYSLPTEAQWEYACRTGRGPESDPPVERVPSSLDFSLQKTVPDLPRKCGTQTPNRWGIRDMLGNVAEWCLDWFGDYEADPSGPVLDPVGPPEGIDRVVRGGSYLNEEGAYEELLRGSARSGLGQSMPCGLIGFRAVLVPVSEDAPSLEFTPADREHPRRSGNAPAAPAPDPSEIEKLRTTLQSYAQSWASNDPRDEAAFFDDTVRWRYAKSPSGSAARAEIQTSIRGKLTAYPRRTYTNIRILELTPQSERFAKVRLQYDYEYAGKKIARGNTEITLGFELKADVWKITEWDEHVSRK
jgi:formylglycine-generating enzyme required for sulfatase activity